MANLLINGFYGADFSNCNGIIHGISLQFHLTAKCDQKCKHCYMYDSEYYENQIKNPLSKNEVFTLLDEYCIFLNSYGCKGHIALSGGDPILSPSFWDVLEYLNEKYSNMSAVSILGNPYQITVDVAKRLKANGVYFYQISIDGLKNTHDYFRKEGSFEESIRALKVLHEAGIGTTVSFTLSKLNQNELLPLYDLLNDLNCVDAFGFGRLIPTGNGKDLKDSLFSAQELKQFLFKVYCHVLKKKNKLTMSFDDQMWRPFFYDLGLADPIMNLQNRSCIAGWMCGAGTVSILAGGTMFPCRRLEMSGGKSPEQSFKELYINNPITRMFRQYQKYKGCITCELFKVCRGCPAMKYAATADFYHEEPNCWKVSNCE